MTMPANKETGERGILNDLLYVRDVPILDVCLAAERGWKRHNHTESIAPDDSPKDSIKLIGFLIRILPSLENFSGHEL